MDLVFNWLLPCPQSPQPGICARRSRLSASTLLSWSFLSSWPFLAGQWPGWDPSEVSAFSRKTPRHSYGSSLSAFPGMVTNAVILLSANSLAGVSLVLDQVHRHLTLHIQDEVSDVRGKVECTLNESSLQPGHRIPVERAENNWCSQLSPDFFKWQKKINETLR